MGDRIEDWQKDAIPRAADNPAGEVPLHQIVRKAPPKLLTADEAAAAMSSRRQKAKEAKEAAAVNPNDGKERLSERLAQMHKDGLVKEPAPMAPAQFGQGIDGGGADEPTALANSYPKKRYEKGRQAPSKEKAFLSKRTGLTLRLGDGIFRIPAITVKEAEFCVTVLVPLDAGAMFVPNPGTEVEVQFGNRRVKTFYPGTFVEVPELECGIMTFIKGD